jgi:hypothetical protein
MSDTNIRIFSLNDVNKVKNCAYYKNGLSQMKVCCQVCDVWQACDHMDNAEPYQTTGDDTIYNRSNVRVIPIINEDNPRINTTY